jgi:RNA polymerase sigma factor (sigma-70 family)
MTPATEAMQATENTGETKAVRLAKRVREMRAHWRTAAEGISAAAQSRSKAQGDRLFVALVEETSPSLAKLARAYFHDESLIEDGVREQITALYEALNDLSGSGSAQGWENPKAFWKCLKRQASNLFIRRLQRDYARNDSEAPEVRSDDTLLTAELPDTQSEEVLLGLLESDALQQLLAAIPDKRHVTALILTAQGMPHHQIAQWLGCSLKSVYNYEQKGRRAALALAEKRYQAAGEYDDWLALPSRTDTAE